MFRVPPFLECRRQERERERERGREGGREGKEGARASRQGPTSRPRPAPTLAMLGERQTQRGREGAGVRGSGRAGGGPTTEEGGQ
jgi:hypothetical protein